MKKVLEYLVSSIVANPKDVSVFEQTENGWVNLTLKVNPEDLKIVIGRKGRTIKALRNLIKIIAFKENKRINLKLTE